ncbi:MAG: class beta-lactamase-related serine hydrolase [Betaproteobacteria bacterium]|nr:class beta-lactamase-related serine hydrolase [Betaproteobacteria bacterium]
MDTSSASPRTQPRYFPDADWQRKTPADAGIDATRLKAAIDHAIAAEMKNPRDLAVNHYQTFGREPFGDAIGPIKERGEQTGLVVHKGYIVAEWGEPTRVDMTHSITKSMLSTVVGLAHDRGLIRSIDDTVREYVPPIQLYNPIPTGNKSDRMRGSDLVYLFETAHNRTITWNHMLRQVSDWEGTLWGKPDWADRPSENAAEWGTRPRNKPGTAYQYNDVRTNALALSALNVWRRPLPQVLKENVLDPIGASNTWRWFGYENSWVVLDGLAVQSVTGGGHWGGGMFINAYDMARFGYLTMNRGKWKERQLVSEQWIDWALTPTPVEPSYGFMNFYNNKDRVFMPSAPAGAFGHQGNGTNFVYVDPENDLVAVLRWIDRPQIDGFVKRLLEAVRNTRG